MTRRVTMFLKANPFHDNRGRFAFGPADGRGSGGTTPPKGPSRTIILAEDGRHVTIGRDSQPSEDEIKRSATALRAANIGAWLATMTGEYYGKGKVGLQMHREISTPKRRYDEAEAAFHTAREAATKT